MIQLFQLRGYDWIMRTVTDTLRRAVIDSEYSRYAIAKGSDVPAPTLCRFVAGHGLRSDNIDKLAAWLGMELRPKARKGR